VRELRDRGPGAVLSLEERLQRPLPRTSRGIRGSGTAQRASRPKPG
jgi:hypothetical protein